MKELTQVERKVQIKADRDLETSIEVDTDLEKTVQSAEIVGPGSWVRTHETHCSAPHRRERNFVGIHVCRVALKYLPQPIKSRVSV